MRRIIEMAMFLLVMTLIVACGNTNTEADNTEVTDATTEMEATPETVMESDAMDVPAEAAQAVATTVAEKISDLNGYKVGDTADDFKLKNIDGEMVSLTDYSDSKGVIVVFTCNTCPYAVAYEDRIIDLHKTFADKGYPVVAINPNDPSIKAGDSFAEMKVRATDKNFPFEYLFDEGQTIFPKFGATKTPQVYLLNKDRVVKYIGAIDDNSQDATAVKVKYVQNAIEAMEKGEEPNPAFTKAVGCSIKTTKI
ncbi:MAG: thioredoxin family protein [Bacteroidota bacterium]